jgi:Domain of unknown function (DUF397)
VSEPEHASLSWRKSSVSAQGADCVEVAMGPDSVYLKNSRHSGGPVLQFLHREWIAFLAGVHNGEFELPGPPTVAEGE